jgi:uncharacterized OB-fold protein
LPSPYDLGDDELLSRTFWEGIRAGAFRLQHCETCGRTRFPPTSFCPACHGVEFSWRPTSGQATVWSYTIVHRAPTPDLASKVPYTLAVGQLREGPLVLAPLRAVQPEQVTVGLPIAVGFHTGSDGAARYHFVPAG